MHKAAVLRSYVYTKNMEQIRQETELKLNLRNSIVPCIIGAVTNRFKKKNELVVAADILRPKNVIDMYIDACSKVDDYTN